MDVLRLNPQPDQTERPKNEPGPVWGAPAFGRSLTAKSLLRVIVEYGRWPKRQRNETYFLGRCPQATMNIAFGEKITDRIAIGGHCTHEPGPVCGAPEIGRSLTAKSLLRVIVEYGRWPKGNGMKPISWGVALRLR
jgi:UDP-N-acetyl-D-mannosaminuronic acid transferase (WecB/TagA/CpsF family)